MMGENRIESGTALTDEERRERRRKYLAKYHKEHPASKERVHEYNTRYREGHRQICRDCVRRYKRTGRAKLRDWYIKCLLRDLGITVIDDKLIQMKRRCVIAHRTFKEAGSAASREEILRNKAIISNMNAEIYAYAKTLSDNGNAQ